MEDTPPNIDLDALLDESRSEPDAEAILAEKRRKRAEIMAKYNNHNLPASASSTAATNSPLATGSPAPPTPAAGVPTADASRQGTDSPDPTQTPAAAAAEPNAKTDATFDLTKHNEAPTASTQAQLDAEHEISAASYNPDEDRKQDALRQLMHQAGDPSAHNGTANGAEGGAAHNHEEEDTIEIEVTDDEADEGAQQSDEDDMFAMALDEKEKKDKPKKTKKIRVKKGHGAAEKLQATGMVVRLNMFALWVHKGAIGLTTAHAHIGTRRSLTEGRKLRWTMQTIQKGTTASSSANCSTAAATTFTPTSAKACSAASCAPRTPSKAAEKSPSR